ncbi:MAG: ATP-binding cassette domain-containing protein [Acidimicrobiaceae bacterium]|nr:ATP-binding cassette domain-containing protein [Acidimicrobiaceae bacterium]
MRPADLVAASLYVAVAVLVAGLANPFWLFLLTSALITAVVAVSVGVIYENAGLLSLCQMSFAGIGAWTVGWLNLKTSLPYLAMLPFAALVPFLVGIAVGIPALRLRGQNLAVFTLVFSAAVARVVLADGFPGLIEGNRVRPPGIADSDAGFFLFCAAILGLIGLLVTALRRSRTGRWWFSVRRSERATAAMGRSVVLTKLSAFAVSAAIAGLGGALLVALNGIVSAASFQPIESMTILTSALMFGAGHFEGALLAGLFGRLIPNFLSDLGLPQDIAPMIFAVGGVVALSRGEGGLSAALRAFVGKFGRSRETSVGPRASTPLSARLPPSPRGDGAVLDITNLSVSYGAVRALENVSLTVPAGRIVGLIGPNGAGKSTLVDAASGFLGDHEGRVVLDGRNITALPPRKRARLGLRRTFQQGHTPRDLTVGGYLDLARSGSELSVDEVIDWFSLPAAPTPIAALDVGSRRILEVSGAVMSQPRIALLDEPAAGLAGHDRERFIDALSHVPVSLGVSVLLIEHDLDVVASLCDTAVVLDFGRVITEGAPAEVLAHPDVVDAYLGSVQ